MNYSGHYDRLIARAHVRVLIGYRERHHIVPRCMGGGNEGANLVELRPEEHYVAHQLLVKMYPEKPSLAYAAMKMAKKATGNRAYGWLRKRTSRAAIGNQHGKKNLGQKRAPLTESHRAKISDATRGLTRTSETKARIAAAKTGKKREPFSAEWRAKLGAAGVGHKRSKETQEKLRSVWIGRKHTAESIAKMSASHKGNVISLETRAKISAASKGRIYSAEARMNMSNAQRGNTKNLGKKFTLEHRAKISASRRAYFLRMKEVFNVGAL